MDAGRRVICGCRVQGHMWVVGAMSHVGAGWRVMCEWSVQDDICMLDAG